MVVQAVRDATATAGSVPVLNVVMSSADPPREDGDGPRLPRYQFPEDAAHALVRAVEYGTWRQRPEGQDARAA